MDVVAQIAALMNDVIGWLQIIGVPSAGIAFAIGGLLHVFGGSEGARKARPWYTGAVIGLVVILGASALATFLQTKITF